jgi:NAD(P)-dependent dehydrogenase (short-subunit alcohol dehydrogenase family)
LTRSGSSGRFGGTASFLDGALDRSVVLGYSKVGLAVRRRLADWPADPAPAALAGHDVVVTGASSGLGTATALGAARLGARVHLVVRDPAKGERARAGILQEEPGAAVEVWRCDVSDLDDVRRFAGELVTGCPAVRALVHNAGAMPPQRTESAQGHEMTMALHVLGPLLMTDLLVDPLSRGAGRVVMVTSGGMYTQRLPVDDPEYVRAEYKPATAYARSKRTQVALLPVLSRRWAERGLSVHATHPGWADTPGIADSLPGFHRLTGSLLRDAEQGADTTVWLSAVEPVPPSGGLWQDRHRRPTHVLRRTRETPPEREAMWRWAAAACGLSP